MLETPSDFIRFDAATVPASCLMQRTRCYYFYDEASRCNNRTPGAGCDAIGGFNRMHDFGIFC